MAAGADVDTSTAAEQGTRAGHAAGRPELDSDLDMAGCRQRQELEPHLCKAATAD